MKIYSLKGMKDYNIEKSYIWSYLFDKIKSILVSYGFEFINFPILENTLLFNKSLNNNILINQIYSFLDKNSRNISLRPEGTSCCLRFAIENGLLRGQKKKLWYFGPMFRYENPQLYRYREFYQLGIEAFGFNDINIELEILLLMNNFFKDIDLLKKLVLEINFLGSIEIKNKYSKYLLNFFKENISIFNKIYSLKEIENNPFKILEIKNEYILDFMINNMYKIDSFLTIKDKEYFNKILNLLFFFKIPYKVNYFLIRGINYYDGIIFEWKYYELKSKLSVCSGGRYNNLSKKLGGILTSGIGLAIGWDRLIEFFIIEKGYKNIKNNIKNKILVIVNNIKYIKYAFLLSENIRNLSIKLIINIDYSISSLNKKINYAIKNNFSYIFIIYKIYENKSIILIKDINNFNQKYVYSIDEVIDFIKKNMKI
ncbi:histidine--tRNA ligase [endosymbiont of Pachyrhynchus infernalis]|uniref:histidine--tRNA ligase n=1 Tax=endosymbiont of Pachyrhynchus infernalis TaxID=1971488 RepID=UPI000DC72F3F|nr:histidine--tRNA ligase [endosymbiont of Pachyrhynchus infernalis]BBA84792.1 histidine--tRNA ligase [endosymbiont of Pachyrhynchus infernalis]